MASPNCLSKHICSEKSLTTAPFSHRRNTSFGMPSNQSLIDAANHQQVILMIFWISKRVLCVVVKHVNTQSSGDYGNKSVLLELIVENGRLGISIFTDPFSLQWVFHCDVNHSLESSHRHWGDAQSAWQQTLSNLKEPLLDAFDVMLEFPILWDITVLIHKIFSWNANIVKF